MTNNLSLCPACDLCVSEAPNHISDRASRETRSRTRPVLDPARESLLKPARHRRWGSGLLLAAGLAGCGFQSLTELTPSGTPIDVTSPQSIARFPGYSFTTYGKERARVVSGTEQSSWLYAQTSDAGGTVVRLHRLWGQPEEQAIPVFQAEEQYRAPSFTLLAHRKPVAAGQPGQLALIRAGMPASALDLPPGDNEVLLREGLALAWPAVAQQHLLIVEAEQDRLVPFNLPFPGDVRRTDERLSIDSWLAGTVHYTATDNHVRITRYRDGVSRDLGAARLLFSRQHGPLFYADDAGELRRLADVGEGGVGLGVSVEDSARVQPVDQTDTQLVICGERGLRSVDLTQPPGLTTKVLDPLPCTNVDAYGASSEIKYQRSGSETRYIVPFDGSQPAQIYNQRNTDKRYTLDTCGDGLRASATQQSSRSGGAMSSDVWVGDRQLSANGREVRFSRDCKELLWIETGSSGYTAGPLMMADLPDGGLTLLGYPIVNYASLAARRLIAITSPGSPAGAAALLIDLQGRTVQRLLSTDRSYVAVAPVYDRELRADMAMLESVLPDGRPELTLVKLPRAAAQP